MKTNLQITITERDGKTRFSTNDGKGTDKQFIIVIAWDGRSYKLKDLNVLTEDVVAGLNLGYTSNYSTNDVNIIRTDFPKRCPVSHLKNEWQRMLKNIESNAKYL